MTLTFSFFLYAFSWFHSEEAAVVVIINSKGSMELFEGFINGWGQRRVDDEGTSIPRPDKCRGKKIEKFSSQIKLIQARQIVFADHTQIAIH